MRNISLRWRLTHVAKFGTHKNRTYNFNKANDTKRETRKTQKCPPKSKSEKERKKMTSEWLDTKWADRTLFILIEMNLVSTCPKNPSMTPARMNPIWSYPRQSGLWTFISGSVMLHFRILKDNQIQIGLIRRDVHGSVLSGLALMTLRGVPWENGPDRPGSDRAQIRERNSNRNPADSTAKLVINGILYTPNPKTHVLILDSV